MGYSKSTKKGKKETLKKVTTSSSKKTSSIPDIIGGPPTTGSGLSPTENMLYNSRIIMDITPCKPNFQASSMLFKLERKWDDYKKLLANVGFSPSATHNSRMAIRIAAEADNLPSDTFTNDYGESFLNQITEAAGKGFGELAQMMGEETATGSLQSLGKAFQQIGGAEGGGTLESLIGGLGSSLLTVGQGTNNMIKKMGSGNKIMAGIGQSLNSLLAGARIDFPLVWKGSGYSPTFSCTVKLYNPNPASKSSTKKYIIAPLAALLTIALPQTTPKDENAFNYPFFCKVNCPGLFKIPAGAISSISVIKGGESNLVSFNQTVSMVDVRIEFASLHNTILLSNSSGEDRPTLKGYLDNMMDVKSTKSIYFEGDEDAKTNTELRSSYSPSLNSSTSSITEAVSRVDSENVELINSLTGGLSGFYLS